MPIHYAVLDAQRRVLYEKAVEVGLPVLGVKTDCLFFAGHDPAKDVAKLGTFVAAGIRSWPRTTPPNRTMNASSRTAGCLNT